MTQSKKEFQVEIPTELVAKIKESIEITQRLESDLNLAKKGQNDLLSSVLLMGKFPRDKQPYWHLDKGIVSTEKEIE